MAQRLASAGCASPALLFRSDHSIIHMIVVVGREPLRPDPENEEQRNEAKPLHHPLHAAGD